MKMKIGENLRRLRAAKGLTQEQLAEVLGVSAQAVSRWENSGAYPDITLLPGLAVFYDTTVDAILGMDKIKSEEAIGQIHCKIQQLLGSGQVEQAVQFTRESLRLYPNDSGLLMSLGEALAHQQDNAAALQEAIAIAQRVLHSGDVSMKARSTTAVNLLFLYLRAGRKEDAAALVQTLPHLWESREVVMPELSSGDGYIRELKSAIVKALVFFCGKIDEVPSRERGRTPAYVSLGVDFAPKKEIGDMVAQIGRFLEERQ